MILNPTLKAPLARTSLSPSPTAAVQLSTRRSVIPLSQTAFLRRSNLLLKQILKAHLSIDCLEADKSHCSYLESLPLTSH